MKNCRYTVLIALNAVILFILTSFAWAVELNGVSLGPTIVDRTVKPGEYFEQEFEARNNGSEEMRLEVYMQDYIVHDNKWEKVENPDIRWSPMKWATIVSVPERLLLVEKQK